MSVNSRLWHASFVLAASLFAAGQAVAADDLLAVEWGNSEIQNFVKDQAASPRRSLGPEADNKLAKIKLPVIGFDGIPGVVQNTFRIGPKPEAERNVVTDDDNPVWYQITERYGDVTVSVEADLRVQHEVGPDYPVYGNTRQGAAPQSGAEVSIFDEQNEEGMEGIIAEYTVMRFGIPYTVKIECSAEAKEQCRDTAQIAKDAEGLKILEANPPK